MSTKATLSQPYIIGAVDKALTVLRLLRDRGPTGVSELGAELNVARSTAHRILGTLVHHGFVEQDRASRAYMLGPFLTGLGVESAEVAQMRDLALPPIRELSRVLNETVQLVILDGAGCRFICGANGNRPLNTTIRVGSVMPAYATSGGKVLLAELSDDAVQALFPRKSRPLTGNTVRTIPGLLRQLAEVRRRGYALNDGESEEGISAVAVPVRDHTGVAVSAVALSLPSVRMRRSSLPMLVNRLKGCADQISADLARALRLPQEARRASARAAPVPANLPRRTALGIHCRIKQNA